MKNSALLNLVEGCTFDAAAERRALSGPGLHRALQSCLEALHALIAQPDLRTQEDLERRDANRAAARAELVHLLTALERVYRTEAAPCSPNVVIRSGSHRLEVRLVWSDAESFLTLCDTVWEPGSGREALVESHLVVAVDELTLAHLAHSVLEVADAPLPARVHTPRFPTARVVPLTGCELVYVERRRGRWDETCLTLRRGVRGGDGHDHLDEGRAFNTVGERDALVELGLALLQLAKTAAPAYDKTVSRRAVDPVPGQVATGQDDAAIGIAA